MLFSISIVKRLAILLVIPTVLTACAVLTEAGSKVALVDGGRPIPSSCKFIADLKENGFDDNLGSAHVEARYDIRNLAAQKGANLVQISGESRSYFPRGWNISGKAYTCDYGNSQNSQVNSGVMTKQKKCEAKGGLLKGSQCVIDI